MSHNREQQKHGTDTGGAKRALLKRKAFVLPGALHAALQSRQLLTSMRLRPAAAPGGAQSARTALPSGGGSFGGGHKSAPAAASAQLTIAGGCHSAAPRTYVPVRTLPLIFAQRKRQLQQQKSAAQHAAPYQLREGKGLLSLPEDVLLKVVCSLSHDELKPLCSVSKALRDTLRNAVRYHFAFHTPSSRHHEGVAPPALGERARRPPRSNVYQVMSRLARGPRVTSGRGNGSSARSTALRALDFADTAAPPATAVATQV